MQNNDPYRGQMEKQIKNKFSTVLWSHLKEHYHEDIKPFFKGLLRLALVAFVLFAPLVILMTTISNMSIPIFFVVFVGSILYWLLFAQFIFSGDEKGTLRNWVADGDIKYDEEGNILL